MAQNFLTLTPNTKVALQSDITTLSNSFVTKTTEVNGHQLTNTIILNATDVSAIPNSISSDFVLTSQTINGQQLTGPITLNASSVSAIPDTEISAFEPNRALTYITFEDGTVSAYNWSGAVNRQTLFDAGLRNPNNMSKWLSNIVKIEIGNSVTNLSNNAFSFSNTLTTVIIPNTVTNIKTYAFNHCTGISSISIPESVSSIGVGGAAFSFCSSLMSIVIPKSVSVIGTRTFDACSSLTSLIFEGKTLEEVQALSNYPWGVDPSIISAWKNATQEWVNSQGFLKEHQSLTAYAQLSDIVVPPVSSVNGQTGDVVLSAESISSGTFNVNRIPTLAISKVNGLQNTLDSKVSAVSMNGSTKTLTNGVVDLGTVLTEHQSLSALEKYLPLSGGTVSGDVGVHIADFNILAGNYTQSDSSYTINYSDKNGFIQGESASTDRETNDYGPMCIGTKGYTILSIDISRNLIQLSGEILELSALWPSNLNGNLQELYNTVLSSLPGHEKAWFPIKSKSLKLAYLSSDSGNFTKLNQIAFDANLNTEGMTPYDGMRIMSIDVENSLISVDHIPTKIANAANSLSSVEDYLEVWQNDDNMFYAPGLPEIGNTIIKKFSSEHAEGGSTRAIQKYSHAEGRDTTAEGKYSHVEGMHNYAGGMASHAEGRYNTAMGYYSHAAGRNANAIDDNSWVWSDSTKYYSHGIGTFNVNPTNGINGFFIGTETLSTIIHNAVEAALAAHGVQ